jgi:uncharacterized Ntn-hydrolase superfamily protein
MRHGTYSIVARDPATGAVGVAVQSHWFSVGQIVPWVESGVGAVATQSVPEPAHGALALEVMREGGSAQDALRRCLAGDESIDFRQLAIVDGRGGVAVHTGPGCIAHAGNVKGDGFSCQANIMASPTVPGAMATAFASSDETLPLPERMLLALEAAEGEGGDIRGRQSAALVVASAGSEPWRRAVDLRIEDHPDPVPEMRRLLRLQRAYELADRADGYAGEGRHDEAAPLYEQAAAMAPTSAELVFWSGLGAAQVGDLETGVARVRAAIQAGGDGWATLLDRLDASIAPSAAAVRDALNAPRS